jgi:hypothetical protein
VTFGRDGTEEAAATASIAGRPHRVTVTSRSTELARDGQVIFAAGQRGRFRGLETADGQLSVEIPPAGQEVTVTVTLPQPPDTVRLDGMDVPADRAAALPGGPTSGSTAPGSSTSGSTAPGSTAPGGTVTARLPASAQPRRLEVSSRTPRPPGRAARSR